MSFFFFLNRITHYKSIYFNSLQIHIYIYILEREKKISYQVNMNHYLYPKGYHPSIGTKEELQCFKNHPLGTKPFQKFITITKKFSRKLLTRSWSIKLSVELAIERSWLVKLLVELTTTFRTNSFDILIGKKFLNLNFTLLFYTNDILSKLRYHFYTLSLYILIYRTKFLQSYSFSHIYW